MIRFQRSVAQLLRRWADRLAPAACPFVNESDHANANLNVTVTGGWWNRLMPPFRVAGKHQDRKHPDSALFQVGGQHDTRDQADAALRAADGLFDEDGYKYRVQELVSADGGEQRWKDLK